MSNAVRLLSLPGRWGPQLLHISDAFMGPSRRKTPEQRERERRLRISEIAASPIGTRN